jgi:hypothetical protein
MKLFEELKRRNVIRVGIAYLVGAWLLAQAADLVLDVMGAPDIILRHWWPSWRWALYRQ